MVNTSAQAVHDQISQTQQDASSHEAPESPLHPMAKGGTFTPPPTASLAKTPKSKKVTLTMGKLSLLAISLSLMLLGAFTFLGGFLLGMWFSSPSYTQAPASYEQMSQAAVSQAGGGTQAPSGAQGEGSLLQRGAKAIDFSGIASQQAGMATEEQLTSRSVPGVPSFLQPLATATQGAIGSTVAGAVQEKVQKSLQVPSTPSHAAPAHQGQSPSQLTHPRAPASSLRGASSHLQPEHHPAQPSHGQASGIHAVSATPQGSHDTPSHTHAASSKEGHGHYAIQLGTYATRENAQSFVNQLQLWSYSAQIIEQKSSDGGVLYAVYTGNYDDYQLALEAAAQIVARHVPGAFVVKVSSQGKGG